MIPNGFPSCFTIFSKPLILQRVTGIQEPIPGNLWHPGRYTVNRENVYHRAQSHAHSYTVDNLGMPVSLLYTTLDRRRKLEYPEEALKALGEHANSMHVGQGW